MNCFGENQRVSEECLETILQAMAEAVLIIDPRCMIRFCNRAMEELSGIPADKMIGKSCRDLMLCACGSSDPCELFKGGSLSNVECRIDRGDKDRITVLKNGRLMYGSGGEVIAAVETITDISALRRTETKIAELEESAKRREGFFGMIGKSRAIREVFDLVELAAASNATVLVTGETGTGKEVVAQTIHEKSARRERPIVKVNCSALPEGLLESELFGHVKGSFTGAVGDKIGRFERAEGGTLFLDEIGEVSPFIQLKLLRFLQEREYERVGESTTRRADVRIVAATNSDLQKRVRNGEFREDLYYRLKVFPIHLPPLRNRKEDIGLLVSHFIERFNRETGKSLSGLTHNAALTLMDYCWPGNIRELENAIEHAFVTCMEGEIDLFDLPLEIRKVEMRKGICLPGEESPAESPVPANAMNRRIRPSREEIVSLIERYHGNRNRAAKHLGVDRTTLWRWMKRMGIPVRES